MSTRESNLRSMINPSRDFLVVVEGSVSEIPRRIWRQKTRTERVRAVNDRGNHRWFAVVGLLKDAPLRGSVSRAGANHVHDRATRSFSLCQRRVWPAWASAAFSLLSPFSAVRVAFVSSGPREKGPLPSLARIVLSAPALSTPLPFSPTAICARVSSFNQIGQSAFPGG